MAGVLDIGSPDSIAVGNETYGLPVPGVSRVTVVLLILSKSLPLVACRSSNAAWLVACGCGMGSRVPVGEVLSYVETANNISTDSEIVTWSAFCLPMLFVLFVLTIGSPVNNSTVRNGIGAA